MPGLVDAHQHLWNLAAHEQPFLALPGNEPLLRDYTESDLRAVAIPAGVSATVVVQTVAEPTETPELLALAAGSDLIAGVVGWVDLESTDIAGALAALRAWPDGHALCGIRHPVLIEPDPDWLARPTVHRGLAAVAAAGLCFDLVVAPRMLPAAIAAATACDELTFVLDHLGNPAIDAEPDDAWARDVRALAALPNVTCKLSGVLSEPSPGGRPARSAGASGGSAPQVDTDVAHLIPYYEIALEAFGPERLMFGSDWPVCTLTASYADVVGAAQALTAAFSLPERAAIFAGTARRVYKLATP